MLDLSSVLGVRSLVAALCLASCAHRGADPAAVPVPHQASTPDAGAAVGGVPDAGFVEWVEYGGSNGIRRAPRDAQRCSVDAPCTPSAHLAFPQCLPPLRARAAVLCGVPCPGLRLSPCSEEAGCPPGSRCRRDERGDAVRSVDLTTEATGPEVCVPPRCRTDADCAGAPRFGCVQGSCAVRTCERDADCGAGGSCVAPELRCMRDATGACRPLQSGPRPKASCYAEPGRCGEHSVEAIP